MGWEPFGSVHMLVRCKHERRYSRTRGADVSFRDVTIRIPDRGCDQGREWCHAPEAWAEIWKVELVEEFCLGRRRLTFACSPWPCGGCHTCFGEGDGKVSIERMYLSPYFGKPFNSKVIKSFIPELRSRQVFFVFRDSYVLCIHVINILCTFHISVLWVCYIRPISILSLNYICSQSTEATPFLLTKPCSVCLFFFAITWRLIFAVIKLI